MPEVSVVLPVFNGAETIVRAARSILEQSFRDLELIVVDDGSTDDTVSRLRGIGDARLRLIEQAHRGVVSAANTATALARAPFIARMDADDVSRPERIDKQLRLLREHELDVVGCQVRILDELSRAVPAMRRYEAWINEETLEPETILALRFVEFPLVHPTILARRSYFEMGYRDGEFPEDYDLMLRASNEGRRFGKVCEVLFDWHDSTRRLTRSDPRYSAESFDHCRRNHLLSGPLRDVGHVDVWGIGRTGKRWLLWLEKSGIEVRRGYDINTRKVGMKVHGVTVAHPDDLIRADGTPLLLAVGAEGARTIIRPQLESQGYRVGVDAWFVA